MYNLGVQKSLSLIENRSKREKERQINKNLEMRNKGLR